MTTKEQERQAIEKIDKIVEGLGANSYVAAAMEGVLELAEKNIEDDAMYSWKDRAESAQKKVQQLEAELKASLEGVETLIFDFTALEYLSSAGLRVLLAAQKTMNRQGSMVVRNVNETITEIFEVTGFCDILTVE